MIDFSQLTEEQINELDLYIQKCKRQRGALLETVFKQLTQDQIYSGDELLINHSQLTEEQISFRKELYLKIQKINKDRVAIREGIYRDLAGKDLFLILRSWMLSGNRRAMNKKQTPDELSPD